MKVKVGNKIYDGGEQPVMVILTKGEREQIADMPPEATKYCIYPPLHKWIDNEYEGIKKWMEID